MKRIFHLIKSLGRGGAETLLSEGLRYSDRSSFVHAYGYFLPWKCAMVELLREQGVEVVCFNRRNTLSMLASARPIAAFLQDWKADLLHCHLPVAGAVGRVAGRIAGVPVVYTEHNKMERYHPLTRRLSLLTWRLQRRVFAVSEEVSASIQTYVDGSVPIETVLNGIDTERFSCAAAHVPGVRLELGIPSNAPVIGTVAVFREQKGLGFWVQAAHALNSMFPDTHFILVGDGPLREYVKDEVQKLGLSHVFHFTGLMVDVRPYISAMDLFMMSSLVEGLPLALLEAMAMGKPVVATRVGGIPEVIQNGENGLLVEARDPQGLARSAAKLLIDKELSARLGRVGRQTIVQHFSLERMVRQVESAYLEVLSQRL